MTTSATYAQIPTSPNIRRCSEAPAGPSIAPSEGQAEHQERHQRRHVEQEPSAGAPRTRPPSPPGTPASTAPARQSRAVAQCHRPQNSAGRTPSTAAGCRSARSASSWTPRSRSRRVRSGSRRASDGPAPASTTGWTCRCAGRGCCGSRPGGGSSAAMRMRPGQPGNSPAGWVSRPVPVQEFSPSEPADPAQQVGGDRRRQQRRPTAAGHGAQRGAQPGLLDAGARERAAIPQQRQQREPEPERQRRSTSPRSARPEQHAAGQPPGPRAEPGRAVGQVDAGRVQAASRARTWSRSTTRRRTRPARTSAGRCRAAPTGDMHQRACRPAASRSPASTPSSVERNIRRASRTRIRTRQRAGDRRRRPASRPRRRPNSRDRQPRSATSRAADGR